MLENKCWGNTDQSEKHPRLGREGCTSKVVRSGLGESDNWAKLRKEEQIRNLTGGKWFQSQAHTQKTAAKAEAGRYLPYSATESRLVWLQKNEQEGRLVRRELREARGGGRVNGRQIPQGAERLSENSGLF